MELFLNGQLLLICKVPFSFGIQQLTIKKRLYAHANFAAATPTLAVFRKMC